MFSLLTKKHEKEVKREYYSRLIFVVLVFVLLSSTTLLFSLTPYFYFSKLRTNSLDQQLEGLKKNNEIKDEKPMYKVADEFKEITQIMSPELSALPIRDKMLGIIDLRPTGIILKNISWVDIPNPAGEFFVRGIARSREDLQKYIQILQSEKTFSGVEFSRNSYYSQDTNIDFSINLIYKPQ